MYMKKFILCLFLCFSNLIFAVEEDNILGLWITEKGKSGNQIIVEIYKDENKKFNGRIKELTIPTYTEGELIGQEKIDLNNKDENLRGRKLVNINFVYSFNYNIDKQKYENGKIYNPENGKEYYSYMKLNDDDTLTVKGSIDKSGFIGKKQTWKRYLKNQ